MVLSGEIVVITPLPTIEIIIQALMAHFDKFIKGSTVALDPKIRFKKNSFFNFIKNIAIFVVIIFSISVSGQNLSDAERIHLYVLEAQRYVAKKDFNSACQFMTTAARLAAKDDANLKVERELTFSAQQVCEVASIKNKEEALSVHICGIYTHWLKACASAGNIDRCIEINSNLNMDKVKSLCLK